MSTTKHLDPAPDATLTVSITRVRSLADGIAEITMSGQGGNPLPLWRPGAHIDVLLGNGLQRQYSLCGDPDDTGSYTIAVLRDPQGRGGSEYIHQNLRAGVDLEIRAPRNLFGLEPADRYVLIAGGIGITPLLAMARELERRNADWRMHYGGRTRASMAYLDEVSAFADHVEVYPQDEAGLLPLDVLLATTAPNELVYCCGPGPLIDAIQSRYRDDPVNPVRFERFAPVAGAPTGDSAFEIELQKSGRVLPVPADKSILDVLETSGIDIPTSCRQGTCGTCEVAIVSGEADHRDAILTDDERASNESLFVCCSRALSTRLVLDL